MQCMVSIKINARKVIMKRDSSITSTVSGISAVFYRTIEFEIETAQRGFPLKSTWYEVRLKTFPIAANILETYFEIESEGVAIFWPFYFGHSFGHKELRAKVTGFLLCTSIVNNRCFQNSKIDHYVTLNAFNINSMALLVLRWQFCFIIPRGISLSLSLPHIFAINLRGNRQTCSEIDSNWNCSCLHSSFTFNFEIWCFQQK